MACLSVNIDIDEVKSSALLPFSSKYNLRQSLNDCGPYNVMIVEHVLNNIHKKQKDIHITNFTKEMDWRLKNKLTLPWGLEKLLKKHGVKIKTPFLRHLGDSEKLTFLKINLSLDRPIILLGEKWNIQHYITVLGFDNNLFYVYDSYHYKHKNKRKGKKYTRDDNGNLPGNRSLNAQELLKFWENGGKHLFFKWYAIVALS